LVRIPADREIIDGCHDGLSLAITQIVGWIVGTFGSTLEFGPRRGSSQASPGRLSY